MMANSLQEIVTRRGELLAERKERTDTHTAFIAATTGELERLREGEALIVGGLDLAKIERARCFLRIAGKVTETRLDFYRQHGGGVRLKALDDAKVDIAAGGPRIKREYFGVKNYDSFGDQRTDCEYCMGPRHGSIVFSIGLERQFCRGLGEASLTAEQVDDALYLLSALPKIEELQAAEKVAA